MRAAFIDPDLDRVLDEDGYVQLPLLDAQAVDEVRAAFDRLGPAPGDPGVACYSSFQSYDIDYKRLVDDAVRKVLEPHIAAHLDAYRLLPCNFIVKWPGDASGFGLHQDLAVVDERRHRSVVIWVALEGSDATNGQLWMVPGSHRWLPTVRGIHSSSFAFSGVAERIATEHAVPITAAAGDAVIFHQSTVHFSPPNRSGEPRLVAIANVVPAEAPLLCHWGDDEGRMSAYRIDETFWLESSPFTLRRPPADAACLGWAETSHGTMTDEDLDALIATGEVRRYAARPAEPINAADPWCHRCGATGFPGPAVDRWVGNVTLLCERCATDEVAFAATPEHVSR